MDAFARQMVLVSDMALSGISSLEKGLSQRPRAPVMNRMAVFLSSRPVGFLGCHGMKSQLPYSKAAAGASLGSMAPWAAHLDRCLFPHAPRCRLEKFSDRRTYD
jgi:hypothetical protein